MKFINISYAILAVACIGIPPVVRGGADVNPSHSGNSNLRRKMVQETSDDAKSLPTRQLVDDDLCSNPTKNYCHRNAVCLLNPSAPRKYECLCRNQDGWDGDGVYRCNDYDECKNNYPCAPPEEGGYCEDRDPGMTPSKYFCGCQKGFRASETGEHGATKCVREQCSDGLHNCGPNALCTDLPGGGYDCGCNIGYTRLSDGCFMSVEMAQEQDTDLGLRFNKIPFPNGDIPPEAQLPMTPASYPISNSTFQWIRYASTPSVMVPGSCDECDINLQDLINSIGCESSNPSSNPESAYWKELEFVVDIQIARNRNETPSSIMPLPTLWKNLNISQVAEAVHDEYPGIHHVALIQSLGRFTMNDAVIPFTCRVEFNRGIVLISDVLTWAIARVGPLNFGLKWTFGRMRPEESAFMILKNQIPEGPPASLVKKIKALPWGSGAPSFTAYPEGSPAHPSFPAMHSAGSAASLWMPVLMDLTDAQWCQVKLTDYAVSFGRTVAGVHYVSDNIAGLQLGQEIIARRLPDYLHEMYGSDMDAVKVRIEEVRFEWKDFLDSDCAKGLV